MKLAVVHLESPIIRPFFCGCSALSTSDSNDRYNSLRAAFPGTRTGKRGAISPTSNSLTPLDLFFWILYSWLRAS